MSAECGSAPCGQPGCRNGTGLCPASRGRDHDHPGQAGHRPIGPDPVPAGLGPSGPDGGTDGADGPDGPHRGDRGGHRLVGGNAPPQPDGEDHPAGGENSDGRLPDGDRRRWYPDADPDGGGAGPDGADGGQSSGRKPDDPGAAAPGGPDGLRRKAGIGCRDRAVAFDDRGCGTNLF